MSEVKDFQAKIHQYLLERDWLKHQKPKDLAISISLEAAEILEHFQWKTDKQVGEYLKQNKSELADEIADVGIYLLGLCMVTDIDYMQALETKLEKVKKKYPAQEMSKDPGLKKMLKAKHQHRKNKS